MFQQLYKRLPAIRCPNIIRVLMMHNYYILDEPFLAIGFIAGISVGVLIAIALLIVIIGILYHLNKGKK